MARLPQAARPDLVLAAGTCFVEVSDNRDTRTGAYILLCLPVVAANAVTLVADVPVSETVNPQGDLDLYTFTFTAAENQWRRRCRHYRLNEGVTFHDYAVSSYREPVAEHGFVLVDVDDDPGVSMYYLARRSW